MFEAVKNLLNELSLQYLSCELFSRLVALTKIPDFAVVSSQRLQKSRNASGRQQRDLIFLEMLEGFTFQGLYYMAVRIFGSFYSQFF